MLKEYIKPELNEDSKVKAILEKYADKISYIMSKSNLSNEDFREFGNSILNKNFKRDLESDFVPNIEKGSYLHERNLGKLYDNELFRNLSSNEEKLRSIVKIINELINFKK